jgi:hypothetical protein
MTGLSKRGVNGCQVVVLLGDDDQGHTDRVAQVSDPRGKATLHLAMSRQPLPHGILSFGPG